MTKPIEWTEVKVPLPKQDTNLSEAQRVHLQIEGSLGLAWEHLKEQAEEKLRHSPDDIESQQTLREYANYCHKQAMPEAKRAGLILSKTGGRRGSLTPTGVWCHDRKYGWVVRVAGNVGDVVPVRKRDGTKERVKLLERVVEGLSFFRVTTLSGGF